MHRRPKSNSSGNHDCVRKRLRLFQFSFGLLFGSDEEGRRCGMGHTKCSHIIFTFVILTNSKDSSQTLAITSEIRQSKTSLWLPLCFAAHCRGERVCLTEPCRAWQGGLTPLHRASWNGHATVAKKLLAAGAVNDAKTEVRRAGDEGCIQGRVEEIHAACCGSLFSGCCSLFSCCCSSSLGLCV